MSNNTVATWTVNNPASEALSLPTGRLAANLGGIFTEQSVRSHWTLEAAEALVSSDCSKTFANQAQIIVEAQKQGLALSNLAQLVVY